MESSVDALQGRECEAIENMPTEVQWRIRQATSQGASEIRETYRSATQRMENMVEWGEFHSTDTGLGTMAVQKEISALASSPKKLLKLLRSNSLRSIELSQRAA